MNFKKIVSFLHLWLGLITGLVVFVVAITGCIYTFEHEIQEITQPYRKVKEVGAVQLPPSQIKAIAEAAAPGMEVRRIYYETPENASMALYYADDAPYFYLTFIDQYTGEVLKVKNLREDFFTIVLYLHMTLLLPYGGEVIAVCTLVFLVMLVTGIVLWWPKNSNQKAIKTKFKIKWNGRWRRKNYDLHSVLGFYASWILVFIAITGLVWSYSWVESSLYYVLSGGEQLIEQTPLSSDSTRSSQNHLVPTIDQAWYKVLQEDASIRGTAVYLPHGSDGVISIYSSPDYGTYGRLDWRYFDQYTLQEKEVNHFRGRHANTTFAQKVLKMNYDIHTGGVLGLTGKFLAFFASLIAASLPVTGVLLYIGRKKAFKQENKTAVNKSNARHKPKAKAKPVLQPKKILT